MRRHSSPAAGTRCGIDIRDAQSGQLSMRLYLPEAFAMLNTDVDSMHGGFLTTDENGQRLFAVTTSGLSIVPLANISLGIGTLSPLSGSAAGGSVVTVRGSGFQSGITAMLGGKFASESVTGVNMLGLTTPAVAAGPQQLVLTNPDAEDAEAKQFLLTAPLRHNDSVLTFAWPVSSYECAPRRALRGRLRPSQRDL